MKDLILILFFAGIAWLAWRSFAEKPAPSTPSTKPLPDCEPPSKASKEARHINSAIQFARQQHSDLSKKQREQDAWQRRYGLAKASELDKLTGIEFEEFLAGLFLSQGHIVEKTPITGDYGADLIISKDGMRIAVQAKRYTGSVGVQAVQEALSGMTYYRCDKACVVTTGTFTSNALELAEKSGVLLISRNEIGDLLA